MSMGSRIITLQRQARELGRLRTGYTDTSGQKPRPVRSATWIVTSHAEHYVQAAADMWGGTPEQWQPLGNGAAQWRVITEAPSLEAILPPGDPLSQSYELWSRGGAQRRCDGMTESLSDQPCLCRAQWGEGFHQVAPRDSACKMTTRLNVVLPELPDIGAWRVETHSYYSANEMAAAVDMLKGGIGHEALIPVRLRIEQRTRVAQGKTKQFPVVAVELRGGTAGQVLAGAAPTVAVQSPQQRQAVADGERAALAADSRTAADFVKLAAGCEDIKQLTAALAETQAAGFAKEMANKNDEVAQAFIQRRRELDTPPDPKSEPAATQQPEPAKQAAQPAPYEGPNRDTLWSQIVAAWPGDRLSEIEEQLNTTHTVTPGDATPQQLAEFLTQVQSGAIKPAETVPF